MQISEYHRYFHIDMAEENPTGFQIDTGADENVEDPGVGQGYVKLLLLQTIPFHKLLLL